MYSELEENTTIVHEIKIDREIKKGEKVEVEWSNTGEVGVVFRNDGHLEGYCILINAANMELLNEH